MNKSTKILLILLLIGIGGTAIVFGYIMGSGQLMSHEDTQDYIVNEKFEKLQLDTVAAQIDIVSSEQAHVSVYAKAWLPEPVNMDNVVDVRVENGILTMTETPFPSTFFGVFPQPYELKLTLYMPREICEAYQEETNK
jgi:hypothetical protein